MRRSIPRDEVKYGHEDDYLKFYGSDLIADNGAPEIQQVN